MEISNQFFQSRLVMLSVSKSSAAKGQTQPPQERHVLVIDDGHRRAIALDAAAYSVGRDPSNAIVLDSATVSRKHAILLRLPIPGENRYRYRLIDGDSNGNASANGVFVNRQRCSSHELVNGDTLSFGRKIQASYLTTAMEAAEFAKYLESIEFHSLKSDLVNSKETLVVELAAIQDLHPESRTTVEHTPPKQATVERAIDLPALANTISDVDGVERFKPNLIASCLQSPLKLMGLIIPIMLLGTLAIGFMQSARQSHHPSALPNPTTTQAAP
jgi:pSer/pThr/pTyr-binding forkhead associated (FHA) protein